jgi:hypothetical protein
LLAVRTKQSPCQTPANNHFFLIYHRFLIKTAALKPGIPLTRKAGCKNSRQQFFTSATDRGNPVIPAQAGIQWCAAGFRVKPGMTKLASKLTAYLLLRLPTNQKEKALDHRGP